MAAYQAPPPVSLSSGGPVTLMEVYNYITQADLDGVPAGDISLNKLLLAMGVALRSSLNTQSGQVTVSPYGIANPPPWASASTVLTINNGADFGPDTTGTTTDGVQEALTSLQATGGKLYCLTGAYQINTALTFTSNYPLTIDGETRGRLEQSGNGATGLGNKLDL